MSSLKSLNDQNFQSETANGVILIDFWAEWCGPCKMLLPTLEEVAAEVAGKATVAKVNVGEANATAAKFGVKNIPALFVLKDGQIVEQFIGIQDKDTLVSAIRKAL